jgi:hypothetical protein
MDTSWSWGDPATAHWFKPSRGWKNLTGDFSPCHRSKMIRFQFTESPMLAKFVRAPRSPLLAISFVAIGPRPRSRSLYPYDVENAPHIGRNPGEAGGANRRASGSTGIRAAEPKADIVE